MGATGGALPLAAVYNGAAFLGIDADAESIKRRVKSGYCEVMVNTLDEALRILKNAVRKRLPASVGLIGNCAEVMPELAARGVVPDLLIDATPIAGDDTGYIPHGLAPEEARALALSDPESHRAHALRSIDVQVRGMIALRKLGAVLIDSGNCPLAQAHSLGMTEMLGIPNFRSEYLQTLYDEDRTPLLCVALSGERNDMARIDRLVLDLFPHDARLRRLLELAAVPRSQGLPAHTLWLRRADRAGFVEGVNRLVADGAIKAPVLLARDLRNAPGGPHDVAAGPISWPAIEPFLSQANGCAWAAFEAGSTPPPRLAAFAALADGSRNRPSQRHL
jgi:urocanate hydratase